jgi:hypothetical protein
MDRCKCGRLGVTVLTRWESVRRKRPKLWPGKWILQHDNALAHDALRVQEFLDMKLITKIHLNHVT